MKESLNVHPEYREIPQTMMAVRKLGEGPGFNYVEVKTPKAGQGEKLIKVVGTGVCGSDGHIWEWKGGQSPKITLPVTLGHEVSGVDVETGKGVALESVIKEMDWYLGINVDGGMASYVVVPAEAVYAAPPDLPLEYAGALEPATVGFQAARLAKEYVEYLGIEDPKVVVLGGTGMIGAAASLALPVYGIKSVIATGRREAVHKLKEINGSVVTVNTDTEEEDLESLIGHGADVVIDTVGLPVTYSQALGLLKVGGIFLDIGLHERSEGTRAISEYEAYQSAHNKIVRGEIVMRGVYARKEADWQFAYDNVGASPGKIDITPLIGFRQMNQYEEAIMGKEEGVFKTILIPDFIPEMNA